MAAARLRAALLVVLLLQAAVPRTASEDVPAHAFSAAPLPAPDPGAEPLLQWAPLAFSEDHHVGSTPNAHFGVRVRNAGGGELQLSFFVTSKSARFYIARPRDLTLTAGVERLVDIRAPLYLIDEESHFHDNATCTIQSNGGVAHFQLEPKAFPVPERSLRVYQMTNGNHAWHQEPSNAALRMHVAWAMCSGLLVCLWCVARAARMHVHGPNAQHCRARPNKPPGADEEEAADVAEALEAVRRVQVREAGVSEATAQRATAKAVALDTWHAQTTTPERYGSRSDAVADAGSSSGAAVPSAAALCSVCLAMPRDTAILPCRHVALCGACAKRLSAAPPEERACPICRGPLDNWLQLFMT